jgi:conjugation system TraG family ATPase
MEERLPVLEVAGDRVVSKMGDVTIAFEITKPEIFTIGVEEFGLVHQAWVKALRVLPAGTVVHMQDVYRLQAAGTLGEGDALIPGLQDLREFRPSPGSQKKSFLQRASDRFFEGRPWLRHVCRLYVTCRPAGRPVVNSAGSSLLRRHLVPPDVLDQRVQREFEASVGQMARILRDSGMIGVRRIPGQELVSSRERVGTIEDYCLLHGHGPAVLEDIDFTDGFRIGREECCLYSVSDAAQLPSQCSPSLPYAPYSSEVSQVHVSFAAGIGLLLPCDHIVSQYVVIGNAGETIKALERKRLRLQSLSKYSRSNAVALEATEAFLQEAVSEGRLPVQMHVNLMAWASDRETLRAAQDRIVSAMSGLDMVAHEETVGAPQLWYAGIPGNAGELPVNECMDSFLEQAICFWGMETNYRSSESSFGFRLGDRLTGRPVQVDVDVEARKKGWVKNGNFFCLAGSGGGKSYVMNHMCRSYYDLGMHILVVDIGNSYKGLCDLLGGVYFTYDQSKPIGFNPFYLEPGIGLDLEKLEGLKTLLLSLWKRADEIQYRSEYVALSNALQLYYRRLAQRPEMFPCFDSFYEFMCGEYAEVLQRERVTAKEFDLANFLYVVRIYYQGGEFDFLLNARERLDLLAERFIVFELGALKDHALLPILTLVIMEVFQTKVRNLIGVRKLILIEEAWKPIAQGGMAGSIRGWNKTLRKHMGKLGLVSQELDDMIDSPIIKKTVVNCSDTKILLDMGNLQNRFGEIQAWLGLTDRQKAEVLSLNKGQEVGRSYKDVWIGMGPVYSKVYRVETSQEEYWTYTSEEEDKVKVEAYIRDGGSREQAVARIAEETRRGKKVGMP